MTEIMGVVNVTPDSFSDGGQFETADAAIAHGLRLSADGATIVDVGGESTRPGATPVPPGEELARALPVVRGLAVEGVRVSIDTIHAATAEAAVSAGASFINDVSGGLHDPVMLRVAAESATNFGTHVILGHWRGIPDVSHGRSTYSDVVTQVREALAERAEAAELAGVPRDRIVLDPGLGFDKTAAQSWELLSRLPELCTLGYPVLIGASRKRMITEALSSVANPQAESRGLDLATAVVTALSARAGAWGVRVHDALGSAQALAVAASWEQGGPQRAQAQCAQRQHEAALPVDRITLTGLEVFAHHGVFDFERQEGQRFLIDVEVAVDLRAASEGDDLARTVHYGELAEAVAAAVERDPVDLIETVAERVVAVALGFPAVVEAQVTIHKPDAPIARTFTDVSVTITRKKGAK